MVQITIMTNTSRDTEICDAATTTPRQLCEKFQVDYNACTLHLDGIPMGIGMMDKPLLALGVTEKAYLSAVVKQDNK